MSRADDEASRALWALVDRRVEPGADREAIDREIWDRFGDECAIVFTDLSGFSRQVAAFGIIHFLQIIAQQKRLFLPAVEKHGGTLIKIEADSLLLTYPSARAALLSTIEMQHACSAYNVDKLPEERVLLCVGVGYGRILRIGSVDVFGQEVNAASKLGEDTAKSNEILVTSAAHDVAGELPGCSWEISDATAPGPTRSTG
jgi:adenylate cyclase